MTKAHALTGPIGRTKPDARYAQAGRISRMRMAKPHELHAHACFMGSTKTHAQAGFLGSTKAHAKTH